MRFTRLVLLILLLARAEMLAADAPTPAAGRARQIVALPGTASNLVVGGGGKYLIAALKEQKHVAVVDVQEKKIAKLIPVDDDLVLVAAGATRLLIHQPSTGTLARYKLGSWEQELVVKAPPLRSLAMGSSSEGPVITTFAQVSQQHPKVMDLESLEENALPDGKLPRTGTNAVVSASGDTLIWSGNDSDTATVVAKIVDSSLVCLLPDKRIRSWMPSADGAVLYSSSGIFTPYLEPEERPAKDERTIYVPAATGPCYITMALPVFVDKGNPWPMHSELRTQCDRSPLVKITDVEFPDGVPFDDTSGNILPIERRLFLLPAVSALVSVPSRGDRLIIHDFNIAEELSKASGDYLFVSSLPPTRFKPGEKLSYQVEVQSKQGGAEFRLENAPSGMTMSPQGLLNWQPARDFAAPSAVAVISIRDRSGQEIIHTLRFNDGRRPDPGSNDGRRFAVYDFARQQQPLVVVKPTPPTMPAVPAPVAPPVPTVATVTPPVATVTPPARIADPLAPFEKLDDNRWAYNAPTAKLVMGVRGRLGGILTGRLLHFLGPDGEVETKPVELPESYPFLGFRGDSIVAIGQIPYRLDVLDRTGKVIRTAQLPGKALNFAMHPTQPVSYVCVTRDSDVIKAGFVVVDELTGNVSQKEPFLGSAVVIDPAGRFLVSSYTLTVQTGQQVVRVPGTPSYQNPYGPNGPYGPGRPTVPGMPRGRSYGPQPNPYGANPYGVPNPYGPGVPRTPDQYYVQKQFESGSAAFVYDLSRPLEPEIYSLFPLPAREADHLRISYDGRRLTGLASKSHLDKYLGFDPLEPKKEAKDNTVYHFTAVVHIRSSDLAYHPALPLTIVAENEKIHFFNAHDGKQLEDKPLLLAPEFGLNTSNRVMFSRDGLQLLLYSDDGGDRVFLTRMKLPLTPAEIQQARDFESQLLSGPIGVQVPFANLTALRGGVPKSMRVSEIASTYSGSVVVVRSGPSTGTGFVVGSSGLVLTCAHCVSPFGTVEVSFQPPGATEKKKYAATVIKRDPKVDLALLQFKPDGPLPTVVLADPMDANNGEEVTVIANPGLGDQVLDNTVTTGVISNRRRAIEGNDYIQSSAAVNPGSSGGPMFDSQGRVIGVVVLKAGIDGVGFAVPPGTIADFLLKATTRGGAAGQLVRSWRDTTGTRSFEGRLIQVKGGSVVLTSTAGGEPKTRPFTIFSPGDQKLLELLDQVK